MLTLAAALYVVQSAVGYQARIERSPISENRPLVSLVDQFKGIDFKRTIYPFHFFREGERFTPYVNRAVTEMAKPSMSLINLRAQNPEISGDATKIGAHIRTVIEHVFRDDWPEMKTLDKEWLIAEAVCEFVKRNVKYKYETIPAERAREFADSSFLLGLDQPQAVCWGISVLTIDIARGAGLKCDFVSCNGRDMSFQKPAPSQEARTHGVVCFILGGWEVGADVTDTVCKFHQEKWNEIGLVTDRKVRSVCVLPRDAYALEFFYLAVNAQLVADM